jgi:hypothetical protein
MRQFVDQALARSRASLVRDLRGILLRFAPIRGEGGTPEGAMSRATLGAQGSDTVGESGADLAELSRMSHMSLGDRTAP